RLVDGDADRRVGGGARRVGHRADEPGAPPAEGLGVGQVQGRGGAGGPRGGQPRGRGGRPGGRGRRGVPAPPGAGGGVGGGVAGAEDLRDVRVRPPGDGGVGVGGRGRVLAGGRRPRRVVVEDAEPGFVQGQQPVAGVDRAGGGDDPHLVLRRPRRDLDREV